MRQGARLEGSIPTPVTPSGPAKHEQIWNPQRPPRLAPSHLQTEPQDGGPQLLCAPETWGPSCCSLKQVLEQKSHYLWPRQGQVIPLGGWESPHCSHFAGGPLRFHPGAGLQASSPTIRALGAEAGAADASVGERGYKNGGEAAPAHCGMGDGGLGPLEHIWPVINFI